MADNPAFEDDERVVSNNARNREISTANHSSSVIADGTNITIEDSLDANAEQERLRLREREPFFYCKWVTTWPKLAFGLTLGGHILSFVITSVLVASGYELFPTNFDGLPMDVRSEKDFLRGVSWVKRYSDHSVLTSQQATEPERSQFAEALELFFEAVDGNVLTAGTLKTIQRVEQEFFNVSAYHAQMCQVSVDTGECRKPVSLIRFFDGTYKHVDPAFEYNAEFNDIPAVLNATTKFEETKSLLLYLTGVDSVVTPTDARSSITRVRLLTGYPMAGYQNSTDRRDDQDTELRELLVEYFDELGKKYFESGLQDDSTDFFYGSKQLFNNYIKSLVITDFALVFASIIFIFVFMRIQTGSFWITVLAIFSIMAGFSTANLIYRVVFDFRYFGIFHVLAIFIILGIGADNVFIFYDSWRQSSLQSFKSVAHRLSFVYRNTAFAMLFTSLTTAVAFIVSATSPILAVWSFGVFSGMLILINYISVIVFLPTVVIAYHLWWDRYRFCCCCPSNPVSDAPHPTPPSVKKSQPKHNIVVRFLSGQYFRFITHKVVRWCILFCFAILIAGSIYYTSEIQILDGQMTFLKEKTNFAKWRTKTNSGFRRTGTLFENAVYLVWGLHEQDVSGCHKTDFECYGNTVWDDSFHLNSAESQQALLNLCSKLKHLTEADTDRLHVRRGIIDNKPEVECFVDEMNSFFMKEEENQAYPANTSLELPVNATKAQLIMNANSDVYVTNITDPHFWRYFEVMASYWLNGGFHSEKIPQEILKYTDLLGEALDIPYTETVAVASGSNYTYGTKLKFAAIAINTTLKIGGLSYSKGLAVRDEWDALMKEELSEMPENMRNGFPAINNKFNDDFNLWHWFTVQKTLVKSAFTGIVVGLCLALPILIIATANIVTGLLASCTLVCITLSVIAVIPMAGWKLSILESLNMTLVVGLSVDYVVHLAEGYSRSTHALRLSRVRDALEQVGVSVISGACTTAGASFVLLFAQILFFRQFGIFMFSTIGFSLLYALVFFTTVLSVIGPQHDFGSLAPFIRWIRNKLNCGR